MKGDLRDSDGQIVINEAEAEDDIQKIMRAKSKLTDARKMLDPKNIDTERMLGSTHDAIEETFTKITKDLNQWEEKCDSAAKYIRKVVDEYIRIDKEYAKKIQQKG